MPVLDLLPPKMSFDLVLCELVTTQRFHQPYYYKSYHSTVVWGVTIVDWNSYENKLMYGGIFSSTPGFNYGWLLWPDIHYIV